MARETTAGSRMIRKPKMVNLEDIPDFGNYLIFGDSGCGKTIFSTSDDKVVIINLESDGVLSAKRWGSTAKQWPVAKYEDFTEAKEYFEEYAEKKGELPFNWLVIDGGTALQRMMRNYILRTEASKFPRRNIDIHEIQDYNWLYNMFERVVLEINALPVNVLWTCLASVETDKGGDTKIMPDISGKDGTKAMEFASHMTSYGMMEVALQKKRVNGKVRSREVRQIIWKTDPDRGIQAKDRTQVLAPKTVNKTLKQIREMINNGPGIVDDVKLEDTESEIIDAEIVEAENESTENKDDE